jgi:hypothetical protein
MTQQDSADRMNDVMDLLKHFGDFAFAQGFDILLSLNDRKEWIVKYMRNNQQLQFQDKLLEARGKTAQKAVEELAKQFLSVISEENKVKMELVDHGKTLSLL